MEREERKKEGTKKKEKRERGREERKREKVRTASDKTFQKKTALTHNFHYFYCRDRLWTSERIAYHFMKSSTEL